jgi:FixJ family two-component response regulator
VEGGLRKNALVAVIGSDESVGWAAARSIRSAGFDAKVFPSAEHFIRSDQVPSTACLVLDVLLPGMSGMQLQSHLASAGRHIPIIFITTSADERARALGLELGAVSFRMQPPGEKALLKEICLILKADDELRTNLHDGSGP